MVREKTKEMVEPLGIRAVKVEMTPSYRLAHLLTSCPLVNNHRHLRRVLFNNNSSSSNNKWNTLSPRTCISFQLQYQFRVLIPTTKVTRRPWVIHTPQRIICNPMTRVVRVAMIREISIINFSIISRVVMVPMVWFIPRLPWLNIPQAALNRRLSLIICISTILRLVLNFLLTY